MTNAMNLIIPTPTITPGPQYAVQVSDDLDVIAGHRHTGAANGDGYQVPTAGLDINEDLSFQSNNATSLRSTRFTNQDRTLSGIGDIGCVYELNGDLWYNNGAGTPIQITSGSSLIAPTGGYTPTSITNNLAINSSSNVILISCDTTSNPIIVTLPLANAVGAGRFYIIKDTSGTAATNIITVSPNGANTIDQSSTAPIIRNNFDGLCVVSDGTSNWMLFRYAIISTPILTTSTTVNVPDITQDATYVLNVTSASITINLPALSSVTPGVKLIIKDSGAASFSSNTISIVPNGVNFIEGLNATVVIGTPFGEVALVATSSGWYMI